MTHTTAKPTLRPYQRDMVDRINQDWAQGAKNVLGVMSTGAGKSVLASDIVDNHNGTACVIAHRQELVTQMCVHLGRQGVPHRVHAPNNVIQSIIREERLELGRSFYDPQARTAVAGVDTLVARTDALKAWAKQVTLWVIDEAHHIASQGKDNPNKWFKATTMFTNAKGLGVTATPQRSDGRGLGAHSDGVFHSMVVGPSMRDLIEIGALTDYRIVAPPSDFDVERLKIGATGDYTQASLKDASKHSHIVGDVVENYVKFASGKRGITFATDVETAHFIADQYREAGVRAQAISAKTKAEVRNDFIRRFRHGELDQLVNVDLFGEGFDLPALEVVSMARPTQSLAVFLQQFGRAMRPMEFKQWALVIDHVGNVRTHSLPDIPRPWSLDAREKRSSQPRDPEVTPVTTCLECFMVYERVQTSCPFCGHEPTPEGRRKPEQVDGDLTMLDPDVLDAMRKAAILETPDEVANRVAYVAGPVAARGAANKQRDRIEAQEALRESIAVWAGGQRAKGRADQESYRRFYLTYGIDVLTALSLNRAESEKLRNEIEQSVSGV